MANEDVLVSFRAEDQLTAVIRNLQSEFKQFNKQLEGLSDNFKSSFNQQANAVKTSQQQIKNEVEKTKSSFIDLRRVIETAVGVGLYNVFQQGVGAIKDFASSALTMAGTLEQTRSAFNVLLGGAEQAKSMLQDLSDYAKKTPFELPQLQDMAKRLTAVGFAGDQILPTLDILGNISAAVGTEKLPLLTLALGQVYTAGKLTGAELRQFSEQGVPMLAELAKNFGVTTAEMTKMISDGKIGFKDVYKVLNDLTSEGGRFAGLMKAQSETFDGVVSNIKDQIGVVARTFMGITEQGKIIEGGFFDRIKNAAESLMIVLSNLGYLLNGQINFEQFLQLSGVSDQIIQSMMWLGQIVQWVGQQLTQFFQSDLGQGLVMGVTVAGVIFGVVIPAITAIASALAFVMSPIGLVIGGVALLFTAWQNNFLGIQQATQGVVRGIGQDLVSFGQFVGNNLIGIVEMFNNSYNAILEGLANFLENFGLPTAKFMDWLGGIFMNALGGIYDLFANAYAGMLETSGNTYAAMTTATSEVLYLISDLFAGNFEAIGKRLVAWGQFIAQFFVGLWDSIKAGASSAFTALVNVVGSKFTDMVNWVIEKTNDLINGINSLLSNEVFRKVTGTSGQINSLQKVSYQAVSSGEQAPKIDWNMQLSKVFKDMADSTKKDGENFRNSMKTTADSIRDGGKNLRDSFSKYNAGAADSISGMVSGIRGQKGAGDPAVQNIRTFLQGLGGGIEGIGQFLSQFQATKIEMPDYQQMLSGLQGQMTQFTPQGGQNIDQKVMDLRKKAMEDFMKMSAPKGDGKKGAGGGKGGKSEAEKELDKQAELLRLKERQLQLEKENIKAQQEMALRPLLQELEDKKRGDGADTTDLQGRITELKRQQQNQLDQLEAKQRQLNQQQFNLDVKRAGATDQFGSGTNITNGGTLNLNGDIAINNTADLNSFANLLKSALVG